METWIEELSCSRSHQLPDLPQTVADKQRPNADSNQVAMRCLQHIGGDSRYKDEQERKREQLKTQSWIMGRAHAQRQK